MCLNPFLCQVNKPRNVPSDNNHTSKINVSVSYKSRFYLPELNVLLEYLLKCPDINCNWWNHTGNSFHALWCVPNQLVFDFALCSMITVTLWHFYITLKMWNKMVETFIHWQSVYKRTEWKKLRIVCHYEPWTRVTIAPEKSRKIGETWRL